MNEELATSPVEVADTSTDTGAETQEVETVEEFDADGNPVEPEPEEEDEEIDLDDIKLRVKKAEAQKVKDGILRQADYTRKTQAHAEAVKAFEAERGQFQRVSNAEITALANVRSIDSQLAEYGQIDWQAWNDQAANAAAQGSPQEQSRVSAAWMEYQQLKDARANAADQFVGIRQQRALASQQDIAKRVEQTTATLSKDIQGWSSETEAKLTTYGMKEFGFTADEIADIKIDPRIAKVLHAAHQGSEAIQKQQKAANLAKGQVAEPARVLKGTSGATPVKADTRDFAAFERLASKAKT